MLFRSEERDAFLAAECGDDAALKAEVRALLAAHEAAGDALKSNVPPSPEVEAELARLKPEEGGEMIGPYKLREQIGEGGFGVVWMAEQEKPARRCRMKSGGTSARSIRRGLGHTIRSGCRTIRRPPWRP